MGYVTSLMCFSIATLAYISNKRIYSPIFTLSFLYGVITFLSSLRLFDTYPIDNEVYIIILLGVIFFALGCALAKKYRITIGNKKKKVLPRQLNDRWFAIFTIVGLGLSLWTAMGAIKLLMQGNALSLIYELDTGDGINDTENLLGKTYLSDVLGIYIAQPLTYLLVPASICAFIRKKKIGYLFLSIIFMLLRVISHGGRAILIFFIGYVVLLIFLSKDGLIEKFNLSKLQAKTTNLIQRRFKLIAGVGILGFLYMTLDRGAAIGRTIYFYLCGAVPHFSGRLPELRSYDYTWGVESLRGFIYPIYSTVTKIIPFKWELFEYADHIFTRLQYAITIAPGKEMNAFVTVFCFFFIDGGIIGVIIGSIILGFIAQKSFNRILTVNDDMSIVIYSMLYVQILLYSFNCCMFSYIQVAWAFVFAILLYRKKSTIDSNL